MAQRLVAMLILLLFLPAGVPPCGPWYDDAHHGLRDRLRDVSLAEFCYVLFHAEGTLRQRRIDGLDAVAQATVAEQAGTWDDALTAWRRAHELIDGHGDEALAERCGERILLLTGHAGHAALPDLVRARDADDADALRRLSADPTLHEVASILLAGHLRFIDPVEAERLLRQAIQSPVSRWIELVDYRLALLQLDRWRSDDDAVPVRNAFNDYLAKHPDGLHRADALGWLAHLRWRHAPGNAESVAIYLRLFRDPDLHRLFVPTVDSLHMAFQIMGDVPSPEVLADPRLAAAFLYDRATRSGWESVEDRPGLQIAARRARQLLPDLAQAELPPQVLSALASACYLAGDKESAGVIANGVLQRVPDATALYLQARMLADDGKADEAEFCWERLLLQESDQRRLAEIGMRVGAAFEAQGEMVRALRCYVRSGSDMDAEIIADGEIGVDEFMRELTGRDRWIPDVDDVSPPRDRLPWLKDLLAARLARVGRWAEALPYAQGERQLAITALRDAEEKAKDGQAASAYALAACWYRQGKKAIVIGRHWHQYVDDSLLAALTGGSDQDRAREANLLAMTAQYRARPLFLAIAERFPDSPEAAKALYSAALCDYWLCGNTALGFCAYWQERSTRDGYWRRGDLLIQQLMERYPDDPLARGTWAQAVRKRLGE